MRHGLEKAKDYHAYRIPLVPPSERLVRVAAAVRKRGAAAVDRRGGDAVRKRGRIETRVFDVKHLRAEVDRIVDIYNESWADNWGFLPLVESEAAAMADNLKLVLDPGLMRFATVEGEPAAVLGALPDPNVPLRPRWRWPSDTDAMRALRLVRTRRHIPVMRLMFFGVRPQFRKLGVDALLYHEVQEYAVKHGYTMCEPSLLLEDNDLVLRASASMNGTCYKTWRVYEMPL